MSESWIDTSDIVVLTILAIVVFVYFYRKKGTKKPDTQPKTGNVVPKLQNGGGASASAPAGLSKTSLAAKMEKMKKDCVVFFGSQTGTAEDYAGRLAREAKQYGFEAMVADMEDYEMSELAELDPKTFVIFAVATYGEGEPTDNAQEAHRYFSEEPMESFKNIKYCVFGLGNKTYEHYNEIGVFIDKKLEEFGAERVFELGLGDDDASLEEDYINWRDKLWPVVCAKFGKEESASSGTIRQFTIVEHEESSIDPQKVYKGSIGKLPKQGSIQSTPPYDAKNPYISEILLYRELMKAGDRHCMHLEINIQGTPLTYTAGDHVGIFPMNDLQEVEKLGQRLGIKNMDTLFTMTAIDPSAPKKHPFPAPCSYRTALTHYLDIQCILRTHILKALIEYADDENEKERLKYLVSLDGKDEVSKFLSHDCRNILEVLECFPSVHPPADLIFELLPRLQPRYYSISSSPEVHPTTVGVCATVLEYNTPTGRLAKGVCTNWLYAMNIPDLKSYQVPIFIRRSNFKLPKNLTKPIIMIGPGTGVAPFRGFVEERAKKRNDGKTVGPNVLFFGCRNKGADFLYDEELLKYQQDGHLELFCAFSRDQDHKVYVQHLIAEQKKLVWGYLEQGGYIYVCGDAKNMAREVNRAIVDIVKEMTGKSEDDSVQYVKKLRSSGRYLEDVWS